MTDYFIRTERLGFSEWTDALSHLAVVLWGDPDVSRLISAKGFFTGDEVLERVGTEIRNKRDYGVQYYPLFLLEDNRFVGCCGLRPYPSEENAYELGFHLLPAYWGKGYATEAAKRVLEYAHDSINVGNIYAGHHPGNTASGKILTRLGFKYIRDEYYPPTGLNHPLYRLEI